jgi:hypothetical protein
MSDRTQSSVRTGPPGGDGSAAPDETVAQPLSVTSTQSIPGASTPRTQGPTDDTSAVGSLPLDARTDRSTPEGATSKGSRPKRRTGRDGRGPRRARLQLRHIDTWSALKISLVLSIALFFIWMVAVGVLYGVLNALGVFETLNDLFGQVGSVSGSKSTGDVITPGVVFGGAAVIGAINIVLLTALCTVGTFIYNLCADLVGGLEITLSERD